MIEVWFESTYKSARSQYASMMNNTKESNQGVFYKSKEEVSVFDPVTNTYVKKNSKDLVIGDRIEYKNISRNNKDTNNRQVKPKIRRIARILNRNDLEIFDDIGYGSTLQDLYPENYLRYNNFKKSDSKEGEFQNG